MRETIRAAVLLCLLPVLITCGLLIDIPDNGGMAHHPQFENQILSAEENPHIRFDFAVDKKSVEAMFSIKDAEGTVQGFYQWEGQTVYFRPQSELIPGRRYVFYFVGTYLDLRGVEYSAHRIVPFYSQLRDEAIPYVLGSNPRSGETIACDTTIRILFSKAIDTDSLLRGFSISPDTPIHTRWENGATELLLWPQDEWRHCRCYTIGLDVDICDTGGIPLAESGELVFWIQEDVEAPLILYIEPVHNQPANLYPVTGSGIGEDVGLLDALRITFSEAMDSDSTSEALTFHPALATALIWLDASTLIVVPTSGFASGTDYTLQFDAEAKDLAGNPIAMDEAVRFTTVPGAITVSTELVTDGIVVGPQDYSTATAIEIQPYPISSGADYDFLFSFSGASFDSNNEKMTVQEAISLTCIFPDFGVADPVATGYSWTGDQNVSVTFSDLKLSTSTQRVYYLLRIEGGAGGISTEEGSRLEEDLGQLLVTVVE